MKPHENHALITHEIVLVGGGHTHVEVIRQFGMKPEPGVRLTLITRDVHTPYSGMLPGLLAGHYSFDEAHINLARLCRLTGTRIIHASVTDIDLERRRICVEGRPEFGFDIVSIDIGSSPNTEGIAGVEHALPVKPVDVFQAGWATVEASLLDQQRGRVVVAGAGAGGVELTLSLQHRLKNLAPKGDFQFELVSRGARLLPGHAPAVRVKMAQVLETRGIALHRDRSVISVEPGLALLDNGDRIECDTTILVTGAAPASWLAQTGLDCDDRGFMRIRDTLQSVSHDFVFGAGDCASLVQYRLPKAGVYAVRQGPVLADNLRSAVRRKPYRSYEPQRHILALISTGDRYAIASRGSFNVSGEWVWRWKDQIDRRWMRKYQEFPSMSEDTGTDDMRCGGCGAKVPAAVLEQVVGGLDIPDAPGLVLGVDSPDDAAAIAPPPGQLLVQSVDQFRTFTDDPYIFARIAANHCLGDLYAMGATPHSALAAITLPHAGAHILATDLDLIMRGALETLAEAGATLIGGHTAEGAEMTFGLTVNGFIPPDQLITKSGAAASDVLILTKPIGTGVVLAADMRGAADPADLEQTLASMLLSNREAARLLLNAGATACTDITGFGLAGHLIEIARASDVNISLDLASIPILPGAGELNDAGYASTLAPANAGAATSIDRNIKGHSTRWQLLFDPQTAGGLAATVPGDRAAGVLRELREAGYPQALQIGVVTDQSGGRLLVE